MCGTVVLLECLGFPSDSITVDTNVKKVTRLSILHSIYKITCDLQIDFFGTFLFVIFELFLLHQFMIETWYYANEFFQCSKSWFIVKVVNLRRLYQYMWGPELPWFQTYISIASTKGVNIDDFLHFFIRRENL